METTPAKEVLRKLLNSPQETLKPQPMVFTLTTEQVIEMDTWITEHNSLKKCKINRERRKNKKKGIYPCGGYGQYSVEITFTTIANIAYVKCACGQVHYLGEV